LLAEALGGAFGAKIAGFYDSAVKYHAKKGTAFPRPEYAGIELLDPVKARAFIQQHEKTSIPNAKSLSRRLFDQMMVEASKVKASK
jgi:hypothetical protein